MAEQWLEEDTIEFDLTDTQESFEHGAKVGRTVIKNWSHVQQRATRVVSYSLEKSVEGSTGTSMELGLSLEGKLRGKGKCLTKKLMSLVFLFHKKSCYQVNKYFRSPLTSGLYDS